MQVALGEAELEDEELDEVVVVVLKNGCISTPLEILLPFVSYVVVVSGIELLEEPVVVVVVLASLNVSGTAHTQRCTGRDLRGGSLEL